jgi:hypothetical protein
MVDGCKSESIELCSGVPQGSILGPLLLILYINNIGDLIETADVHFYSYFDRNMAETQRKFKERGYNNDQINIAIEKIQNKKKQNDT